MMKIVTLQNIQITMICLKIMGKRLQKFKIFSKTTLIFFFFLSFFIGKKKVDSSFFLVVSFS